VLVNFVLGYFDKNIRGLANLEGLAQNFFNYTLAGDIPPKSVTKSNFLSEKYIENLQLQFLR
jgi:hypothetical protein